MKGFFKRDLYLLLPNLRFYLLFIAVMGFASLEKPGATGFLNLYIMMFGASSLLSLFAYDEAAGWSAYAAAAADGRRQQVAARYLLALAMAVTCLMVIAGFGLTAQGAEGLLVALLYGVVFLLYTALLLPLGYKFGTRSRLILIIIIGLVAGLLAGGAGALVFLGSATAGIALGKVLMGTMVVPILLGLGCMGVSYLISQRIMAKKEF